MSKARLRLSLSACTVIILTSLFAATPASSEERVRISTKQTKEQIKTSCDNVGGFSVEGSDGKGYGCYNPNNGVLVACDNTGACMGFIPNTGKAAALDLSILGPKRTDRAELPADPFKPRAAAPTGKPMTTPKATIPPG